MGGTPWVAYWLAAGCSGFASPGEWRAWADRIILRTDQLPDWLIRLSVAGTPDDLWSILPSTWSSDDVAAEEAERRQMYDAVLGYYWLRLERGDLDLASCLKRAGEFADAYETETECESFYKLLNRLEADAPTSASESSVRERAAELFAPLRSVAERQWRVLNSAESLSDAASPSCDG